MIITLKNFRCYENSTFDFGDGGIVLLSGGSGSGKSSIVIGIYFALFGTGTKVVSFGKSTCCVILKFDDMTITRTKKPNRLVVTTHTNNTSHTYEDGSAQNIINTKFGESFKTTGYISQNARDSFVMMSPIEKLGFLESFSFHDVNLTDIKKRCKDLIKERNDTLAKTTAQLDMASCMVSELDVPDKISFPIKCSKKSYPTAIKNETTRKTNSETLIRRAKKKTNALQKELQALKVYNAEIRSTQESLDSVVEKLANCSLENDNIEYDGDDLLKLYEDELTFILSQRELISLEERYRDDVERLEE